MSADGQGGVISRTVTWFNDPLNYQGPDGVGHLTLQHLWITFAAVVLACLVALPAIMAGVRIATVSTVALVTVGVIVGYGGLGQLLLAGFQNNFYRAEIMTATVLTVALALVLDLVLLVVTRAFTPWARRRTA